ncbi:MAG TPA: class I SAM-dependent methyltransferase [Thermoanaerobaculia bacterium]|nr:class I SAM-dependent methyltransferase [Thermoanaerobaculia bacterium]
MAPGFFAALSLLRRTSAGLPSAARLHVLGRFLTCPFLRVLEHVPPGARVLDLGAGHGTLARLAVEGGAARVVAVEPDVRKTLPAFRHPQVWFVAGYADAVAGAFGAVTVLDVLYRIPLTGWDPLLHTAFERLRPGGVFLLKEIDPEHRLKGAWNRTQERIADLLGMTLGEAFSYETREQIRNRLERHGFERFEVIELGAGYPHAHILYTARRPAG